MSYWQPEIPLTFESSSGGTVATFPLANYVLEQTQALRVPSVPLVNADYEYDQLGTGTARKAPGVIRIACSLFELDPEDVDDDLETLEANIFNIGLGKLWAADSAGARRWRWARATALPAVRWQAGDLFSKGLTLEFRTQSDWQAESATVSTHAYAITPSTYTITNPGNRRILNAVLLLKGVWTGPVTITNTTNGYGFTYDGGDAGASNADQVRFDAGANRVDRSSDTGATWSNVFASYTPNAGQVQMMILEPGANSITITDGAAPNATLVTTFYA